MPTLPDLLASSGGRCIRCVQAARNEALLAASESIPDSFYNVPLSLLRNKSTSWKDLILTRAEAIANAMDHMGYTAESLSEYFRRNGEFSNFSLSQLTPRGREVAQDQLMHWSRSADRWKWEELPSVPYHTEKLIAYLKKNA